MTPMHSNRAAQPYRLHFPPMSTPPLAPDENSLPAPPAESARTNFASEDRLSALLDAAVDPIVLIDSAGRILRFSRAAERLFGYGSDEVLGRNVKLLMPQAYAQDHDQYIHRYQQTGTPRIIGIGREVTAQRKDGSTFPIDLSVGEFRSGAEQGFVGILRDISERKRQEQELLRSTAELRLIFDNAPTAMSITDIRGHILDANHACQVLLGYQRDDLLQRRYTDLTVDEDRAALVADFLSLNAVDDSFSREVRFRTPDGGVLYALLYAGVVCDIEQRSLLMIVGLIDRSALFAATREADELRDRLVHAGRLGMLGVMVSGIAHEVNQPLTAIANYANAGRRLLQNGLTDAAELVSILDKIGSQADRAGQVIRSLRSLTRKREQLRERLDCNALIEDVSRLMELDLRANGLRLQLKLSPALPPVHGDAVQIQQVVLNLIRNAAEAMQERRGDEFVRVTSSARARAVVEICVSDSGPGLSVEVEDRLFEPFLTTKPEGMGLGLSICKSIVSAHGGELLYRRGERGGAEFVLRLPTATE